MDQQQLETERIIRSLELRAISIGLDAQQQSAFELLKDSKVWIYGRDQDGNRIAEQMPIYADGTVTVSTKRYYGLPDKVITAKTSNSGVIKVKTA